MTGEVQRILTSTTDATVLSHDGWAIGGDATGFSTGIPAFSGTISNSSGNVGMMMNNGYPQSPGSEHPGGANYGLGDGSVKWVVTTIDQNIFDLAGSMADRVAVQLPD